MAALFTYAAIVATITIKSYQGINGIYYIL